MRLLSYWAKANAPTARLLIVILYFFINIIALITGSLLWAIDIELQEGFLLMLAFITVSLYLMYPAKASYYKRKLFHGLMAVCTFLLITFFGNQLHNSNPSLSFLNSTQAVTFHNTGGNEHVNYRDKHIKEKRFQKRQAKTFLQKLAAKKDRSNAAKILLITLTIIVALGLLYLLAALSCTIACNGVEALAILVAIAGTFGIVFGVIRIIQVILGKERRKKRKQEATG